MESVTLIMMESVTLIMMESVTLIMMESSDWFHHYQSEFHHYQSEFHLYQSNWFHHYQSERCQGPRSFLFILLETFNAFYHKLKKVGGWNQSLVLHPPLLFLICDKMH
jgi:hypothetical protein